MSKLVERHEIIDYQTYETQRSAMRRRIMEIKRPRRIHLGDVLTFLFENRDTVRYQIQEMMRAEQIVKESAIQHEIETYNELLGGDGELGCALLIEIDDPVERVRKLEQWKSLPGHIYTRLDDGTTVRPGFDPRQVGERRLSAVQYLKFATGGRVPVALGCDLPGLELETELTEEQRRALAEDLGR
ncbi:MAG: DUF3501 family protein [Candidatus Eiseniibacteriota bacterium]